MADLAATPSLVYLFYLYGEDVRYNNNNNNNNNSLRGSSSSFVVLFDKLEAQAAASLQQSFAVVGLLNESNVFFDTITVCVQYINTTTSWNDINGSVRGVHRSNPYKLKEYFEPNCFQEDPSLLFDCESWRLEAAPKLRAILCLFRVAEEVNQFQIQELEGCSVEFSETTRLRRRRKLDLFAASTMELK
jgi:hypothetical protein